MRLVTRWSSTALDVVASACYVVNLRLAAHSVDYLASDFHGHARLEIYKDEAWALLVEFGAEELLNYLSRTNPSRLLDDQPPLPVPILPPERRFWARFRRMLRRSTA